MRKNLLLQALWAVILGASLSMAQSALAHDEPEKKIVAMMTPEEREKMVRDMQQMLDDLTRGRQFFYADALPVTAKVWLDEPGNVIVIDLDERLGPRAYYAETEDMTSAMFETLWPFLERIDGPTGIKFLYGGRDVDYWPDNRTPQSPPEASRRRKRNASDQPLVVVAPGHGVYFHGGFKDWRAQRDPANGVLEDDLTPTIAGHLVYALQRDNTRVDNLRPEGQVLTHEPSQQPWWRLAARYQLAQKYPNLDEVWGSMPEGTYPLHERDQDIRSRPYYANHVKADALIHIHTNAETTMTASGLRTYIVENPESRALAERILCSAKELIRTDELFSGFDIASRPHVSDRHGENKYAKMPSVIVEVGFHTNPKDAEFLRNRTFQALAMRGVAKGYRLYRNKLPCDDFSINPVDDVTGRVGVDVHLPFSFKGNPVYPIRVWTKDAGCTATRGCGGTDKVLSGPSDLEKFKVRYLCHREHVDRSPISLTVTARDFDGVRATPATYKIACTR